MKKVLDIYKDLCTGCRMCEMACSLEKTGTFGPFRGGVSVFKDDYKEEISPVVCRQCKKAPCIEVCPIEGEKPLTRDEETGAVVFNEDTCIKCYECVRACPFGAIWVDPENEALKKCDLCGGEPECVNWCPTKAISFVDPSAITTKRAQAREDRERRALTDLDYGTIHIKYYT